MACTTAQIQLWLILLQQLTEMRTRRPFITVDMDTTPLLDVEIHAQLKLAK